MKARLTLAAILMMAGIASQAQNPIIRDQFSADPSALVVGDRVYVFLFIPWLCISACLGRTLHFKEQRDVRCGYTRIYRYGFSDFRNAFRCSLGKRGLGALLELGSEGNLGSDHLAELYAVYTSEIVWKRFTPGFMSAACILFCLSSDVLVGSELSSIGPGKRACV